MRGTTRILGGLAVLTAAAFPAQASAVINSPPANGHILTVFPSRDMVSAEGYGSGDRVTVQIVRNGLVIGTAANVVPQDDPGTVPFDGLVEVNHPGGACWTGSTPDILPGDIARLTTAPNEGDETPTANVVVTALAANVGGNIVVRGTARDSSGNPLPLGAIEQRLVAAGQSFDVNGRRTLRAPGDGTIAYDAPGSVNWTATYRSLGSADIARAVGAESRIMWLGRDGLSEITIFEAGGSTPATPGPAAPCTAPLARTAMTNVSHTTISNANAGTPLTVSGVAAAGITRVTVSIPGASHAVTPSGGTWSVNLTAADLAAAPQGSFDVTAAYTGTGAPPAERRSLFKDTVAPAPPTATPGAGTYEIAQSVALSAEPGAAIHWTNDGTIASAASAPYFLPLAVIGSGTISAVAVDGVGNTSAPASFGYLIVPKPVLTPVVPGGSSPSPSSLSGSGGRGSVLTGGTSAGPVGNGTGSETGAGAKPATTVRLRLRRLRVRSPLRVRVARQGIPVVVDVPDGTQMVRLRLFRLKGLRTDGTGRPVRVVTTVFVGVAGGGRHQIRLPALPKLRAGAFRLGVRAGATADELGPARTFDFRVKRFPPAVL